LPAAPLPEIGGLAGTLLTLWPLLGVLACGDGRGAPTARAAEPARRSSVHVEASRYVELTERVSSTGTLRPDDVVVVKAEVSGRVVAMSVDLGSPVKRGQLLAQVDSTDARLRVAQTRAALRQAHALLGLREGDESEPDLEQVSLVRKGQATLDEARGNFERSTALAARKLIGGADLDASRASLLRAESALSSAREEVQNRHAVVKQRQSELALAERALTNTQIVSPLDGFVQVKHVSRGELLAPGSSVATVVDVDPLRLRMDIPDRVASKVVVGDRVHVVTSSAAENARVEAEQGHSREGKVARIAPVVDDQNRTLTIEAEIPHDPLLRPGAFVRAEIELGHSTRALMVPSQAVVVFAGLEKVLRVEGGKALETVVVTGRKEDGLTELLSGLQPGVQVILEPATLQSGDEVEVVQGHSHAEAR
jgi:RND family efflux transporter MFP subunit